MGAAGLFTWVAAAALATITFVTTGGVDLAPNTYTEMAIVLAGAAAFAAAIVLRPHGRAWGGVSVAAFAGLAALTAASTAWSVQPADSWVEANRTLSYLAAFAGAVALARLLPARWPSLLAGVGAGATIVCAYALLVKVFPASLDPTEFLGRLRAPFGYWNAVGLMAALGLPACVWGGAQRQHGGLSRALAVPAICVLVIALVLCYSRGALLVTAAGLGLWFAVVPLRLRGAVVLALGSAMGAIGVAWALATHPITVDRASLASRVSAGHSFGLLLALLLASSWLLGIGGLYAMDRFAPPAAIRRRIGLVLVCAVACVPVAGAVALATSSRGFTGEVSHLYKQATDPHSTGVNDNAGRLAQVSNSRARYWTDAFKVGEHHLLLGAGALGYATARTRYSSDTLISQHAHSYVAETFADLGLLGIGVSLALLVSWALAAARSVRAADPAREERAGLLTMLAIVVTFGIHSAIDWTWFVPGVTIPALACAGWLAGRGPLGPSAAPARLPRTAAAAPARLARPAAIAVTSAVAAVALVCAWTIWQPQRSAAAAQASLSALGAGHIAAAYADAHAAISRDPVSAEPLWDLATIQAADGHPGRAHATLARAVRLQPANPASWLQLGEFDLSAGRTREASAVLQAALYLAPFDPETLSAISQARAALQPSTAATPAHTHP